jgi:hypothetical protein
MANRKMIHKGEVTVDVPERIERELNPETGIFDEIVVEKASTLTYKLAPGAKFGAYVVGRPVEVPKNFQKLLKKKGFEFISKEDLASFEEEDAKGEAQRAKERDRAMESLKSAPGGVTGHGEGSDAEAAVKGGK